MRGRGRRLRAEADQRRRDGRQGDARRGPQAQARRAGRHAAAQHAAPDRGPRQGREGRACSARSAWPRSTATTTCGRARTRPTRKPPENLDYEMWTGPAPDAALQQARPPAVVAGVHGVRQRHRRRHVHPHARHGPLDVRPRLAHEDRLHRRHPGAESRARRTSPTRRPRRSTSPSSRWSWNHRTYGDPADRDYPWGATIYGEKGTLKLSVHKYEFFPVGQAKPTLSGTPLFEDDKYPEDKTEKDLEQHVASAIRGHMARLPEGPRDEAASRSRTSSRGTSRRRAASWRTSRCSSAAR